MTFHESYIVLNLILLTYDNIRNYIPAHVLGDFFNLTACCVVLLSNGNSFVLCCNGSGIRFSIGHFLSVDVV